MTSNRVGGPTPGEPGKGPDTRMQEQHRKIEKVEKVRAVDETENEQTRKKFQRFMDDDEEPKPNALTPSPFETGFHAAAKSAVSSIYSPPPGSSNSSLEDLEGDIVSSPSYSPPPNCSITSSSQEQEEEPPLPQNQNFWSNVDSPPDQPPKKPSYQEAQRAIPQDQTSKYRETSQHEKRKKEHLLTTQKSEKDSLYGPPGKITEGKKEKKGGKEDSHKQTTSPFAGPEIAIPRSKEKQDEKESRAPHIAKKTKQEDLLPQTSGLESQREREKPFERDKEGEQRDRNRKSNPIEIASTSESQLPISIVPLATAATTQAAPYLSPQIAPLFFQMVGTIYVMTATSGVSTTEILLNAPAFANSKFYGSTISIEKYASAPDSLNIRLTGTNQAVLSFNQNISNLYAAFQNGNFNFRIGRISAEYSIDKPVFRRKDSGEGRSDSGGGDLSDRRGNK